MAEIIELIFPAQIKLNQIELNNRVDSEFVKYLKSRTTVAKRKTLNEYHTNTILNHLDILVQIRDKIHQENQPKYDRDFWKQVANATPSENIEMLFDGDYLYFELMTANGRLFVAPHCLMTNVEQIKLAFKFIQEIANLEGQTND